MKKIKLQNLYESDRTVLKNILPIDVPMCISIEPSNLCNFKCVMCYHGNNENAENAKPLKNMDWTVFEKILADIKIWISASGGGRIRLVKLYSLGEPLINPQCMDMVRALKEADVAESIEITTNGSLLTKDIAEKIVEYGLDIIRFSIYALDDEEQRRVTRSHISVDNIYNNIKYLYEYREKRKINTPKIFVKMFDAGVEKNELFMDKYKNVSDVVGIDQVFNMDVGEGRNAYGNFYGEEKQKKHDAFVQEFEQKKPCRYLFTHMTIRNDGTVIACCADWLKEICFGNVMEHTLQEIWQSKSLYELRRKMLETKGQCFKACRSCEIPYRDLPEDSLDEVGIELFDYNNEF